MNAPLSGTPLRLAIIAKLKQRGAPCAFQIGKLHSYIKENFPESGTSSCEKAVQQLLDAGMLTRVTRETILNSLRTPAPPVMASAHILRKGSVVSLHSVLGECGFLNNPSAEITCVIPVGEGPRPSLGALDVPCGASFRFKGLPSEFFPDTSDSDCWDRRKPWPSFTPEKAFIDWLRLSSAKSKRALPPPPMDSDLDILDMEVVRELAIRFSVIEDLSSWIEQKNVFDSGGPVVPTLKTRRLR